MLCLLTGFFSKMEAATVKGRVLDSRSSRPVAGATVSLVGTMRGGTTDTSGTFAIIDVPVGTYVVRAHLTASGTNDEAVVIGSPDQTVEVTLLLNAKDKPVVPGCVDDFVKYQADLQSYLTENPDAVTFSIGDFQFRDSLNGSVVLSVTNNSPFDVYLLREHDDGRQMYVKKLIDASGKTVPSSRKLFHTDYADHELADVIRVPKKKRMVVDTVTLQQYNVLPSGEYQVQFVYVFPGSRASKGDGQYDYLSPLPDEKAVGELYCMTLQGRYESNWLPIQIK